MTSKIIVLGFEGEYVAEGLLESIEEMQKEGLIELEDAVTAQRGAGDYVEIKKTSHRTGKAALEGGGIGLLAGLLLGGPIGGMAAGAVIGAITAKMKKYGLDDKFIQDITDGLIPDSSLLFLMVKKGDVEAFVQRLEGYDVALLMTSLSPELEKRIESELDEYS